MTIDVSKFHVIAPITNPMRYASRYRLYNEFKQHMVDSGVNFWTVELALGDRPFAVTSPSDERNLQLRTDSILWHKENQLNLIVENLPEDWEYVAWIDADIQFPVWRGDNAWFYQAVHALQVHRVVQLFDSAVDLGPNGEVLQIHRGFASSYLAGLPLPCPGGDPYYGGGRRAGAIYHSGFAWAMRRETWDQTGGLIDFAALGAGDAHMAWAWIGDVDRSVSKQMTGPYISKLRAYQARCDHFLKRDIGFVPGSIIHAWHGRKKDRRYQDRWKILADNAFDPDMDLKRDWQGLLQLTDLQDLRSIALRDGIRRYHRQRNEDTNEV